MHEIVVLKSRADVASVNSGSGTKRQGMKNPEFLR